MGDVIHFLPPQKSKRAADAAESGATGQLLLFTGVRYQQLIEIAPAPLGGEGAPGEGGGKRKRKRG